PLLFDRIDESPGESVDDLGAADLKAVADECTLCDMCFMVKCPYVPPHEFNIDFPHLMLRYRAVEHRKGETSFADRELARTDRNGKLARFVSGPANAPTRQGSSARGLMPPILRIAKPAHLPPCADVSLSNPRAQVP